MNDYRMNLVIFEYNEEERNFHENVGTSKENTNGYRTICETYFHIWDPFKRMIDRNYTFEKEVPFVQIKNEWDDYMTLRKDIEECNLSIIDNEKKL